MNSKKYNLEDILIKYLWIILIPFSAIFTYLYSLGIIKNISGVMSDVIVFASIIFAVIGLILTLLISLRESPLFERLKKYFPYIQNEIYKFTNKILFSTIGVVIMALIVKTISIRNFYYEISVSFIGLLLFMYMLIGTAYLLKFSTDMVIRNLDLENDKKQSIK